MSDENKMMDDDDDVGVEVAQKPRRGGGIITTILKWVGVAIGALIVVVTVSYITVKVVAGQGSDHTNFSSMSEEFREKKRSSTVFSDNRCFEGAYG